MASLPLFADPIDPETARKVASSFLSNNGANSNQLVDLSKAAGFSNLYIFNGEEGFVVMAADDCVKPILGYSLTGRFVTEDMPENITSWLQGYNDEIQYAIVNNIRATTTVKQAWTDLINGNPRASKADPVVSPLIETQWGQGDPYNKQCPLIGSNRTITGCVATAMAQIMNYWEYPDSGIGSHSYIWNDQNLSANFGSTSYDWANMTNTYGGSSTQAQKDAVATLMYHCGVSVDMNYGIGSSGAVTSDVALALVTFFNYKNTAEYKDRLDYNDDVWIAMLKAELDATPRRPIQYRGVSEEEGGHSFICDGYDSDNKFHFNWGWNGYNNGYYSIDEMTTGALFTTKQGAIFGIEPSACILAAPSSLVFSVDDTRNVTLTWSAVTGAISYNIYRNDMLIGNTTETTLENIALFGDNNYYVRCVDASGLQSLASNIVTVNIPYPTPTVNDLTATLSDNNVTLSWTAPDWCYPETPTSVLNYGEKPLENVNACKYYAHRHIAADLASFQNQVLFKVSTFVLIAGTYSVYVYTGTTNEGKPGTLRTSKENIVINGLYTWYDFILDTPVAITGEDDLWIVMEQENTGQFAPVPSFNTSPHNPYIYYGDENDTPTSISPIPDGIDLAWYINGYLTDGIYSYNIYDGSGQVASNVALTSYSIENIANNNSHCYTIKTQFNGGETEASNMIGYTKGNATLVSLDLGTADKMTVAKNSTLTVGTLTNTSPENLILEDGAKLINSNTGVKATVKKTIEGFQTDNNQGCWYLIASPVTEQLNVADETNLKAASANDYDLYVFNQASNAEWCNYKQDHFTTIDNKTGYLYAHRSNIDIALAGTLNNTDGSVPISYTSGKPFAEYNLVGNPFPCDATIDKSDFYRIVETQEGSKIQLATTSTIAPMEGIFVKAVDGNDKTVTFSKETAKGKGNSGSMITMSVSSNPGNALDIARIRFDGNLDMEKLMLRDGGTRLFIPQSGLEYALVVNNDFNDIPVNFTAATDGTYTIDFEIEGLTLDYLHLIDNLTGANIDLLAMPSYSFEAKTDDYPSRFRLLFNATDEHPNDFDDIEGDILIMDVTGRVVSADRNAKLTPGVYILKTVNGNDIKTKKIIIK